MFMTKPDWRVPADYAFAADLSPEQWAWEFLRRNPGYRREWADFRDAWQALEAAYGRPPERDFQAWQRDPRAYVVVGRDAGAGDCRVDEDQVLIECALGARWGFYKFPLDPACDRPVIGEQLSWREVPQGVRRLEPEDKAYLGDDPVRVGLGFDLDLPLREQLERAKRYLLATQRGRVRDGAVRLRTVASLWSDWQRYLRCLDGLEAAAPEEEMARVLERAAESLADDCREAQHLRDGGYRDILLLPV
jgi:hypothetical protein